MDDTETKLAQRIRLERNARAWSLADLATRSGVAKATISKIERNEMSPSAVILVRLAVAFELTLAGLLLRAEGSADLLSRASDQSVWRDPATGYLRKQIFSKSAHPLELVDVELPAGKKVTIPATSYAHIRQILWVQEGRLTLFEGEERHVLQEGDCLGFGPPSEVTFLNDSKKTCRYIVALTRELIHERADYKTRSTSRSIRASRNL